jgi:hypothetical protein
MARRPGEEEGGGGGGGGGGKFIHNYGVPEPESPGLSPEFHPFFTSLFTFGQSLALKN